MGKRARAIVDSAAAADAAPPRLPCPGPGCAGHLVPQTIHRAPADLDHDGVAFWVCSESDLCSVCIPADADRCPNDGAPLAFDASIVGKTVGGLSLRGWNTCAHCGGVWLTRRGVPYDASGADGRWRLSAGGRSLDVGDMRVRAEAAKKGQSAGVVQLMARLSRMPAFEAALDKIASGQLDADAMRALAAEALSIGDGADEIDGDA